MLSQLNIIEYFVEEIILKTNLEYNKEISSTEDISVDFDIFQNEENRLLYKVTMVIEIGRSRNNSPYYIFLKLSGIFSYEKNTNKEYIDKTINLNAPSMLYGIARGVISQITASSLYGKFILPSVNFIEILKRKTKNTLRKKNC